MYLRDPTLISVDTGKRAMLCLRSLVFEPRSCLCHTKSYHSRYGGGVSARVLWDALEGLGDDNGDMVDAANVARYVSKAAGRDG